MYKHSNMDFLRGFFNTILQTFVHDKMSEVFVQAYIFKLFLIQTTNQL